MKTSVANNETRTELQVLVEGDEVALVVTVDGVVSSLASPTQTFYRQNTGSDVSSTYFTGSPSIPTGSIDTIVSATTTSALKAGDWVLSLKATVDGQSMIVATIPILVLRRNQV